MLMVIRSCQDLKDDFLGNNVTTVLGQNEHTQRMPKNQRVRPDLFFFFHSEHYIKTSLLASKV